MHSLVEDPEGEVGEVGEEEEVVAEVDAESKLVCLNGLTILEIIIYLQIKISPFKFEKRKLRNDKIIVLLQNIFYRKQIEFKENSSFFSFFFQVVEKMVTMREIVLKAAEEEEEGVVAEVVVVVLAEVVVVVLVEVVEGVADPAEGVAVDVLSVESLVTFLVIVGSVNFVVV